MPNYFFKFVCLLNHLAHFLLILSLFLLDQTIPSILFILHARKQLVLLNA